MFRTITPILSLVVAVLTYFFFTQGQIDEIKAARQEIDDYKVASEQYAVFEGKLSDLLARKTNINITDKERLDTFLPDTLETTKVLVNIEAMAKRDILLFGNVTVSEEITLSDTSGETDVAKDFKNAELAFADISFDIIGTYDQFKKFLRELESSLTLLEVTNIGLMASGGQFQQYTITVRTYALQNTH